MPYISSGGQVQKQKEWSLARIPDLIWGFFNVTIYFFRTLFNPAASHNDDHQLDSFGFLGRASSAAPRRRMGRINHGGGAAPPPAQMGGG